MQGNGQEDVMSGDNAVIERVADPANSSTWKVDPVTGGVFRKVTLLDTEKTGAGLDIVSGGDFMVGNDENDRMFGEGGNDLVKGNANDDLVEGNQDGDWLEGNDDEDDLIGGSSFPDLPDTGDVLWGGDGADVLAGDNTCLVRQAAGVPFNPTSCEKLDTPTPTAFHYVTSQLGRARRHAESCCTTSTGRLPRSSAPTSSTAARASTWSSARTAPTSSSVTAVPTSSSATAMPTSWSATGRSTAYAGIVLPTEVGGTLPTLQPVLPAAARHTEHRLGAGRSGSGRRPGRPDRRLEPGRPS